MSGGNLKEFHQRNSKGRILFCVILKEESTEEGLVLEDSLNDRQFS